MGEWEPITKEKEKCNKENCIYWGNQCIKRLCAWAAHRFYGMNYKIYDDLTPKEKETKTEYMRKYALGKLVRKIKEN